MGGATLRLRVRRDKCIVAYVRGNVFQIRVPDESLCAAIKNVLTYNRLRVLMTQRERREHGGRSVIAHAVQVWMPAGDSPQELIVPMGMFDLVEKECARRGYRLQRVDVWKHPHPEVYEPHWDALEGYTFRPGQREVLEAMASHDRGLIIWPTGVGKSFIIRAACLLFRRARILITTRSQNVLEDRYADLCGHVPIVGMYCSKRKTALARVFCCSAGCLHHIPDDCWDMVLVDEYHEFGTDKAMAQLARFWRARMFGFSANYNDRLDKADFELRGIFGTPISVMSYSEAVQHESIVPIQVRWYVVPHFRRYREHEIGISLMRSAIWRNPRRNQLIAEIAKSFPADTQILITVSTIEHALHLKRLLPDFEVCYAPGEMGHARVRRFAMQGLIDLKSTPLLTPQRAHWLKRAFERGEVKRAIATSVWKRGVNFRQLQVLIRADGATSHIDCTQIPGRLSRVTDDGSKECGILIDFIDDLDFAGEHLPSGNRTRYMRSESRYRDYARHGWEQIVPQGVVFPRQQQKEKRHAQA
jgi:superfamily II DNA or RNA helicase